MNDRLRIFVGAISIALSACRISGVRQDCRTITYEEANNIIMKEFSYRKSRGSSPLHLQNEEFSILTIETRLLLKDYDGISYAIIYKGDGGTKVRALLYGDCQVQLSEYS